MGLFKRKEEIREIALDDPLLTALLSPEKITVEQALNIPTLASCVDLISKTIAMIPVKLYQEIEGKVVPVDDVRVKLLNDDTKDTLDGYQFKKAIIEDFLLYGASYSYINKIRNTVKSIHFVENTQVSINKSVDPIFKRYELLCHGKTYRDFEFLKLTRKTKDGVTGKGIVEENQRVLSVAYNSLIFENVLVKTGGNKKGFLKSQKKLTQDAIDNLKKAWKNLYQNNTENVVVLNEGLDFSEASNTSVEMQLNENKKTNANEICKLFNVPPTLLDGKATDEEYNNFVKIAILPLLIAFATALNKDLLLEKEKESFYFAFDTKELLKGSMEQRYKAYSEAVKAGWISKNEIRYIEDLENIEGLDVVTMSLGEVIYDIKSKKYFTPNMDSITNSNLTTKESEVNKNESGDKE